MNYYLIYLAVMSIISLILYGLDKHKAKKHVWRIKEAVLLGFGFFGGALGALLGMMIFHHKTKHWYFWTINIFGLILQIAAFIYFFMIK